MKTKLTDEQEATIEVLSTDAQTIDFIEFRKTRKHTWLTINRRLLLIKNMSLGYILNCLDMLERSKQKYTASYKALLKEVRRRAQKDKTK